MLRIGYICTAGVAVLTLKQRLCLCAMASHHTTSSIQPSMHCARYTQNATMSDRETVSSFTW